MFFIFITVNTEIPIIKQTANSPTNEQQKIILQQIKSEPQSNLGNGLSALDSIINGAGVPNGVQLHQGQPRPLLHGLLSGNSLHHSQYHRNYCTSSTGK